MSSVVDEYFRIHKTYIDRYGTDIVVIIQVGKFYEIYQTTTCGPNLEQISKITNLVITKKNKSIEKVNNKNPRMVGFPLCSANKYIKILLNNGYKVVVVDQKLNPESKTITRVITEKLSPGTMLIDDFDTKNIISLYVEEIEKEILVIGISIINLGTGKSTIHEVHSEYSDHFLATDEVSSFINNYSPREILITTNDVISYSREKLIEMFGITQHSSDNINYYFNTVDELYEKLNNKLLFKITYQEEYLSRIYTKSTSPVNCLISTIEQLGLERSEHSRNSMIQLLLYCEDHVPYIIQKLSEPEIYDKNKYLFYGNDVLNQLNITSSSSSSSSSSYMSSSSCSSLFDIINMTCTNSGKRFLYESIISPLTSTSDLLLRYELIEKFINCLSQEKLSELVQNLNSIYDIEKLHRKLLLEKITPIELYKLYFSYINTIKIITTINLREILHPLNIILSGTTIKKLYNELITFTNNIKFNLNELKNYDPENCPEKSIFAPNHFPPLDLMYEKVAKYTLDMKNYVQKLSDDTGLEFQISIENNGDYWIMSTKKRYQTFAKTKTFQCSEFTVKNSRENYCKFSSPIFTDLSSKLKSYKEKIKKYTRNLYVAEIKSFVLNKFITKFINIVDFIQSGARVAQIYHYICPQIKENSTGTSYFIAHDMRHPIIERVNLCSEFIPFDISLGKSDEVPSTSSGILLFGVNSSGKSSVQKSCGLCIILAQIGYFVPCSSFIYFPYHSLFTRITNEDNLYKGLSTFTNELVELNNIIKRSDINTLVIADEICKGTEYLSSLIIVASMIKMLTESHASFISATHLHDLLNVPSIKEIISTGSVGIFHLGCKFIESNGTCQLIFPRKLEPGQGESFYGVQMAKYYMQNTNFIEKLIDTQKEILPNECVLPPTVSTYNSTVFRDKCAICGKKPGLGEEPLETHHIIEQSTVSDSFGHLQSKPYLHKNHVSNLTVLCKECHKNITT